MQILVKCKCTDGEAKVPVRDREDNEDIRDYMTCVQLQLGVWHSIRGCPETEMEYIKIPLVADKPIGVS